MIGTIQDCERCKAPSGRPVGGPQRPDGALGWLCHVCNHWQGTRYCPVCGGRTCHGVLLPLEEERRTLAALQKRVDGKVTA